MNRTFTKGEIVEVNLGSPPNEIKGHEQAYTRPCIVVKSFNPIELAIVIPLTTKQPKHSYYTIVKILQGSGGLNADSFVLCHQIRTVSFDRIKGTPIGKLDNRDILKIHAVVSDALDL